jgi:hypothetical protein
MTFVEICSNSFDEGWASSAAASYKSCAILNPKHGRIVGPF